MTTGIDSPPVALYDTLLRDGSQMEGIAFSLADKIAVARRLDQLGIHYVEGGFPGSNEKDRAFFEQMKDAPLERAKLVAFGGTRKPGSEVGRDFNIAALRDAETPVVTFRGQGDRLAGAVRAQHLARGEPGDGAGVGRVHALRRARGAFRRGALSSTATPRIRTTRCKCCARRSGRGRST